MVDRLTYFNAPSTPADAQSFLNVLVNTINALEGITQTVQTQNIINGVIAGTQTQTSGSLSFVNSNGVTFGLSNNSQLTASVAGAGGFTAGMSNLGNSLGTTGVVQSQILFAGGTNMSLSQSINGQSATLSFIGANQTIGAYAVSNTTLSTSNTIDIRSLSFAGAGAVSVGISNSSVQISGPVQTAQTQSNIQAIYDGANSISTGTIRLTNANGVSFSVNGQTLSASVASQSNQTVGFFALGNTTQNSSTTFDARTLSLRGAGGVSVGASNGSIVISGASAGGAAISRFANFIPIGPMTNYAIGNGSQSFLYMPCPYNISASRADVLAQIALTLTTNTNNVTLGLLVTELMAIYTNNAGTLSSLSTATTANTFTYLSNFTQAAGVSASVAGARLLSIPINVSMTPGEYYVMVNMSTNMFTSNSTGGTSTTNGGSVSIYCNDAAFSFGGTNNQDVFANFYTPPNNSVGVLSGAGIYSVSASSIMPSVNLTGEIINQSMLSAQFCVQLRNY